MGIWQHIMSLIHLNLFFSAPGVPFMNSPCVFLILLKNSTHQIWGYACGGNGMNVLPYAHPQLFKVFKHQIYE